MSTNLIIDNIGRPIGATRLGIKLVECSNSEADAVIKKFHYSHKVTKNRFLSFSINDGLGYIQLGYGIRPKMKHTIYDKITTGNYCEFDRMWLSDELPKFSESKVIGLLLSYLRQVYPQIIYIITYADESAGNKGIIYRATNAIELDSVKCDFYILPSGERVHPVTMWHRHKTRVWNKLIELYPGIQKPRGFRQRRFLYIQDNKERTSFLKNRINN